MNVTVITPSLTRDAFFTQQPGVAARWPVPRCLIVTTSNVLRLILIAVFRVLADPGWVDLTRTRVSLGSKAVNIAGLTLLTAVPAVAGSLITGRLLLPDAGLSPAHGYALITIASGPTLRAAVGSVLYLGLIALLSIGIGTILRDTAVSTGTVLALLYLPPLLAQLVSDPWRRHIQQIAPMTAGLAIQATRNIRSLPIPPWTGLGVLAAWAAGTLLVGLAVLKARDA
jgi:ABC-2 type transport system permease protein